MKGKFSRRDFMQGSLVLGGGLALGNGFLPKLALANQHPDALLDNHYIFCYFSGGWDILLSLDPRNPNDFHAGNMRNTGILPGYDQLNSSDGYLVETNVPGMTFGPHIGPLADLAEDLAIIRGMSMDTLTHAVGRRRFLTGKPPSGLQARGSSGGTWLAGVLGEEKPIPHLAMRCEAYNKDLPNYATAFKVNSIPDLLRALQPAAPFLEPNIQNQIRAFQSFRSHCPPNLASSFMRDAEAARLKTIDMVVQNLDALFDFGSGSQAMNDLCAHYNINPNRNQDMTSSRANAAVAAQALKGGISRCVSLQITGGLDTHFDNWADDQGPNQEAGFDAIKRLVDDLKSTAYPYGPAGDNWMDHTVIVGFSEFSRTAMLNSRGGRDHALTNACFVLGNGIKGGTVVGASSDVGMEPQGVNMQTGDVVTGGDVIHPEHVLQVLYRQAGIGDEADLRVGPLDAIIQT